VTTLLERRARSASLSFWLFLALSVWLLFPASCGKAGGGDSESHFLGDCDRDGVCGRGLSCLCGVCSEPCEEDLDCNRPESSCRNPSATECSGNAPASLCDVACTNDIDCEPLGDFVCRTGQCRERTSAPVATGGSGGTSGVGGFAPTGGIPFTGGSPAGGANDSTGGANGGVPAMMGGGVTDRPGGDSGTGGTAAGAGQALSNEICSQLPDAETCEARGCNPVINDNGVFRVAPQAGSGGTGVATDCNGSGGRDAFLGCTLGSGGDVALCYCQKSDPTRCVYAASEFKNIESSWELGDCGECFF
jgi:hypothetical protein